MVTVATGVVVSLGSTAVVSLAVVAGALWLAGRVPLLDPVSRAGADIVGRTVAGAHRGCD